MDEFIRLTKNGRKNKFQEANKLVNQVKNRYKSVSPYDDILYLELTRVIKLMLIM